MNFTLICAIVPHTFYLVYFIISGYGLFIAINAVSLVIYAGCFWLIARRRFTMAAMIVTAEVALYAIVSVYHMGFHLEYQWFFLVILVPHYLFFKVKPWQRALVSAILFAGFMLTVVISQLVAPVFTPDNPLLIQVVNICVVVLCVILELEMGGLVKYATNVVHNRSLEKYKQDSFLDPLTGLSNRRFADRFFSETMQTQRGVYCFAMMDMDDFKAINDVHGHETGDRVLVALSALMRSFFRSTDLISRWGGEEFLVVLEGVVLHEAKRIMESFRAEVAQLWKNDSSLPRFTLTIGVAEYSGDARQTISECDRQLYAGKCTGKDQVKCGP